MSKWNRTQVSQSRRAVEAATAAFRRLVEELPGEDLREAKARRKAAREQRNLLKRQAKALRRVKKAHQGQVNRQFRALVAQLPEEREVKAPAYKKTRKSLLEKSNPKPTGVRGTASGQEPLSPRKLGLAGLEVQALQSFWLMCQGLPARGFWDPAGMAATQERINLISAVTTCHSSFRGLNEVQLLEVLYEESISGGSSVGMYVLGDTPMYRKYITQAKQAVSSWGLTSWMVNRRRWRQANSDAPLTHPGHFDAFDEYDMILVFEGIGFIPKRRPAFQAASSLLGYGAAYSDANFDLRENPGYFAKAIALLDLGGEDGRSYRDEFHHHSVLSALSVIAFAGDKAKEVVEILGDGLSWEAKVNRTGNLLSCADPEGFPVFWRSRNGGNIEKAIDVVTRWDRVKEKGLTAKNSLEELYKAAMTRLSRTPFQEEASRWETSDHLVFQWEARWNERCREEDRTIPPFAPFEKGGFRVEILHADDPRGLFLGHHVVCCQRPRGAGETSAWHGAESKDGRFLIISSRNGITAQGWVWKGQDCLVIDNIEASGGAEARVPTLMPVIKRAVAQWGVPVRMGTGYMDDVDPVVYPKCADIESPPAGCYSDATQNQVWVVRPDEVVAPTTETKTTDGLEVSPMAEGEQGNLHAIAARLYPEGWRFADLDGVVLVLRDGVKPVGYACLNPEERRVEDIAVLPTARRGVKALTEAMFQVMGNHTWTAEARETTSLPMLRRMAQRGRIGLVVGGVSHYVGDDACYEVEITPL